MPNRVNDTDLGMVGDLQQEEDHDDGVHNNYQIKTDTGLELFRMVFDAAQKPDNENKKRQDILTIVLTVALCLQLLWALAVISCIIWHRANLPAQMITFISLLVTAILAEVVAMAFVVVRFVFRTPLDTMLELLKNIIDKR